MKIKHSVLKELLQGIHDKGYETGGILGGRNGIVTSFLQDEGMPSKYCCEYIPNVDLLNQTIETWSDDNIEFMGIYHTHYHDIKTLSKGDCEYITNIMDAMPDEISELFFPLVVFPQKEVVVYSAYKNDSSCHIALDKLSIVD